MYVRNAGCPPFGSTNPWDPCPSPGVPTEVALVELGYVQAAYVYDTSTITMSGASFPGSLEGYGNSTITMSSGYVDLLAGHDNSTITLSGGFADSLWAHGNSTNTMNGGGTSSLWASDTSAITIRDGGALSLAASGDATITLSGGNVGAYGTEARDSSTIVIMGSGFAVDGSPVPYGDLTAQTGTLTGTLASGDYIDTVFFQGGYDGGTWQATGTIRLVFGPPVPALSTWGNLTLVSCLIGLGVVVRAQAACAVAGAPGCGCLSGYREQRFPKSKEEALEQEQA